MLAIMDLYDDPCMRLHEMIENDVAASELDCDTTSGTVQNDFNLVHLPPLEGLAALDSFDSSWLTDPHGPLNSNDLDGLDVGLMVNPQTGLPSLVGFGAAGKTLASVSSAAGESRKSNGSTSLGSSSITHYQSQQTNTISTESGDNVTTLLPSLGSQLQHSQSVARDEVSDAGCALQHPTVPGPLAPLGRFCSNTVFHLNSQAKKSRAALSAGHTEKPLGSALGSLRNSVIENGCSVSLEVTCGSNTLTSSHATSPTVLVSTDGQSTVNGKIFPKPPYSYSCLIFLALTNCITGAMPVNDIYNFMIENFPFFKTAPNGWKNSVRHNLSLNKCFEKIEKATTGPNGAQRKGCLWTMNPSKVGKMEEEIQKWSKKDPEAIRRSMAKPDRLDLLEKGLLKNHYTGGFDSPILDDVEDLEEEIEAAELDTEDPGQSSADEDLDALLPDTPPTSQDEAGSVKVKLIDNSLDKFEGSPWDTWETLQPQDESKLSLNQSSARLQSHVVQVVGNSGSHHHTATVLTSSATSSPPILSTSTGTVVTAGNISAAQQHMVLHTVPSTVSGGGMVTTQSAASKKLMFSNSNLSGRRTFVNTIEGGTLCATASPNTYIFTPSAHGHTAIGSQHQQTTLSAGITSGQGSKLFEQMNNIRATSKLDRAR